MTLPVSLQRSKFGVSGMDCADCAVTLEKRLAETPGVESCAVRFNTGSADVTFNPQVVSEGIISNRIRELGYGVNRNASTRLFTISGMDCADCAETLQASISALPGVNSADVAFGTGQMRVSADLAAVSDAQIRSVAERLGYRATSLTAEAGPARERPASSRRSWEIGAAALLSGLAISLELLTDTGPLGPLMHVAAAVLAGYPVARAALISLQVRRADMNLLMTIAAIGAIALRDWAEASTLMVLFAVGLALQSATIDRTRGAIRELMAIAPATARVRRNGSVESVPVDEVATDELVELLPGDRVPVDGIVIAGASALDQSAITGESIPRPVEIGSSVIAGSVNGDGNLTIRATSPGTDTTVTRIIHLVESAHESRAPAQALVERFASIYTPVVVIGAIALAIAGLVATSGDTDWVYRALVLLVVACPCALVISTPVAFVSALGRASRMGVLFKGGQALEALATVKQFAFDKTGTLTHGRPDVVSVDVVGGQSKDSLLALAAALEAGTTHPIGRGISRAAATLDLPSVQGIEVRPGQGVVGTLDGAVVQVGGASMFREVPASVQNALETGSGQGYTVVLVGRDGRAEGAIALADSVRPISEGVVQAIKSLGLKPMLLSGDVRTVADLIGSQVGIDDVHAGLLPADKARFVAEADKVSPIAMVGDGINDAPALAAAAVGIAMGAGGSAAAIEAAEVALMSDDLTQLPRAIRLARSTRAIIVQNIVFALASKLAFLSLTVGGYTSLWLAVLADVGASLVVTLNALRLFRNQER